MSASNCAPWRWPGWPVRTTLGHPLLKREARALILSQEFDQLRQSLLQNARQRIRRIDDEHAAAVQAVAIVLRRPDRQCGVQPFRVVCGAKAHQRVRKLAR